jgi:hypothetical protein
MAWTYDVNKTPATGADIWIEVITTLLSVGWTLPQWSDATNVHVAGAPVAANLKNYQSWFRLRSPADPTTGAQREIVVQNGQGSASYQYWAMKYSAAAGFTSTTMIGQVSLVNGSTTVYFLTDGNAQYPYYNLPANKFLVFATQPTVAYQLNGAGAVNTTHGTMTSAYTGASGLSTCSPYHVINGNATVTNGSAAVTFASPQTFPVGAGLIFAAQPTVVYYVQTATVASTSATLTTMYGGTGGTGLAYTNVCTALNVPVALDEVMFPGFFAYGCLGDETRVTLQPSAIWNADGGMRFHMVAGDATENYSWEFTLTTNTTTNIVACFGMDILTPWAGAADQDCAVCIGQYSGNSWNGYSVSYLNNSGAFIHSGGVKGALYQTYFAAPITFGQAHICAQGWQSMPVNSWSGENPIATPVWVSNQNTAPPYNHSSGVRGYSQLILADLTTGAGKTNLDLFSLDGGAHYDHIWINNSLLPWPSGVAVTL